MKKLFLVAIILFAYFNYNVVNAQQKKATVSFSNLEHDYGKIKESDGKTTYKFEYTNTGGEPLVLTDVKASCGCTTPDWTKEPVAPGKKGFVSATYDPKNRPGPFNKTITVNSNAENGSIVLRIKGDVVAKEPTIEDKFPTAVQGVRFSTNHVAFQSIKNTEVKTDSIKIINTLQTNAKVMFKQVPEHISVKLIPETLKPNEKGIIIVTYDGKKAKDWGFVIDRLPVQVNDVFDEKSTDNRITVSATVEEDFAKLTPEQLNNAPKIEFESQVFDFGTIKQGEKAEYVYKFKNTGKSELVIRKTKASCGCTVVDPADKIIPPGKESSLKASFNSTGKEGKQNKTITVITNDPKNSSITLKVTGTVSKQ